MNGSAVSAILLIGLILITLAPQVIAATPAGWSSGFRLSVYPNAASVEQGGGVEATINVGSIGDFASTVYLSTTDSVSGIDVNFEPNAVYVQQGTTVATVTFSVSSYVSAGDYYITLEGQASNGQTYTSTFHLGVTAANSDLDLYVLSNDLTIPRGGDAELDLRVISIGAFSSTVYPSSDEAPAGITVVFSPGEVYLGPGDSTIYAVRVFVDPSIASDIYYIPLTVTSLDGNIIRTCILRIFVPPMN